VTGAGARGGAVAAATAAALVLLPGTAAADVTVAASRAEPDARNVTITFRVTNADPAVPTTGLQVFLPTARPLLGVRPAAPTGWRARVDTAVPTAAPTTDGDPTPEIATAVTWAGGTLTGTGYAVFPVDVDRLPGGAGPLRFRVVQTFADGATEEWSDLVPYGAPPPAHPALVVPYGTVTALPAGPAHAHHGGGEDVGVLPAADGTGWFVALAGAGTALVAAASVVLGRRQRRRLAALFPGNRDSAKAGGDSGDVP
jgi:uncharacterized protein YcnI